MGQLSKSTTTNSMEYTAPTVRKAEARGCRLEDAVDKPFVVRETAGRGEGAGFRPAYGGGAEDGRRPVGPHLDGDRPAGPRAVVAIHDGHRSSLLLPPSIGRSWPRGSVSIRIGPLVAGEPGVGLEKGRSRIEADDLIRRVGEGVRRFGIRSRWRWRSVYSLGCPPRSP